MKITKRFKESLQVREMVEGAIWNLEKDHYHRTTGSTLKEKGVQLDQLKRSQIPEEQRLVLVSENIRNEFRDLCSKIQVTELEREVEDRGENFYGNVSSVVVLGNGVKLHFVLSYECGVFETTKYISINSTFKDDVIKKEIVDTRRSLFQNEIDNNSKTIIQIFLDGERLEEDDTSTIFEYFVERMNSNSGEETLKRIKRELKLQYFEAKDLKFFVVILAYVFKSWILNDYW